MNIGVSLVNYHTNEEIKRIALLYSAFPIITHIVIVDNDTKPENKNELVFENGKIKVIFENNNLGYSKGNNIAIDYLVDVCDCSFIIISNSDIEVSEEAIKKCISFLEKNQEYGVAAPRMLDMCNNIVRERTLELGYLRVFLRIFIKEQSIDSLFAKKNGSNYRIDHLEQSVIPGSFFVASGKAIKACNKFDEKIFLYREEECLNKRLQRVGYKEALIEGIYYKHNHNYKMGDFKSKILSLIREIRSEKYYFSEYLDASRIQLAYLTVMHLMIIVSKSLSYLLKKGIKQK